MSTTAALASDIDPTLTSDIDLSVICKDSSATPVTQVMTLSVSHKVLMTMTDMSSQAPWTAEVLHTEWALVFSHTRVLCHMAPKVSGGETAHAAHLAPVRVVATVNGFMLMQAMSSCKGPTTL